MNFETLTAQHAEQNAKLDRILTMNAKLVRDAQNGKIKTFNKGTVRNAVVELALAIVAVVWLGDFIAGNVGELKFLVPAVLLDICAIAFLGTRVLQLSVLGSLDYEGSTEALENGLDKVRHLRNSTTKWTTALSFVLWVPALIVGVKGLLGVAAMFGAIWLSNRKMGQAH